MLLIPSSGGDISIVEHYSIPCEGANGSDPAYPANVVGVCHSHSNRKV